MYVENTRRAQCCLLWSQEAPGKQQDGARHCQVCKDVRDGGRHTGEQWRPSKDREIGKTWDDEVSFLSGPDDSYLEKENK